MMMSLTIQEGGQLDFTPALLMMVMIVQLRRSSGRLHQESRRTNKMTRKARRGRTGLARRAIPGRNQVSGFEFR
jgi:hypothetical protein